jgi:hypothetical protein
MHGETLSTVPVNSLTHARRCIKAGWILGLISSFLTLVFALAGHAGNQLPGYNFNLFNLIDAFLLLVMTFGIYQKSRIASTSMVVYFLLNKAWMWSNHFPDAYGLIVSVVFAYGYFGAMKGTFTYHRLLKDSRSLTEMVPINPDVSVE